MTLLQALAATGFIGLVAMWMWAAIKQASFEADMMVAQFDAVQDRLHSEQCERDAREKHEKRCRRRRVS